MPQQMDKRAEEQLLAAVKSAMGCVMDGDTPTEAITKAAQHYQLSPTQLPLIVQAYNVGRTTYQRGAEGVLAKQATFPLADLQEIHKSLYPAQPQTTSQRKAAAVISPDYAVPPRGLPSDHVTAMEKAASYTIPTPEPVSRGPGDPATRIWDAYGKTERYKRAVDDAKVAYTAARDRLLASLGKVASYFAEAAPFRARFGDVEYNAIQVFGEPARHVLTYAHDQLALGEKRAMWPPKQLQRVDVTEAPYSLIKVAIDRTGELLDAYRDMTSTTKEAEAAVEQTLRPFVPAPSRDTTPRSVLGDYHHLSCDREKEAGFFGNTLSLGVGASLRNSSAGRSPDSLVDSTAASLADPEHLDELRAIQTRAMLSDFLSNDEVISGYDPAEVMMAFNELSQMSPRSTTQPGVMRPLLRKRLSQGAVEPFEAQQITDIEKNLGEAQGSRQPMMAPAPKAAGVLHGNPILS